MFRTAIFMLQFCWFCAGFFSCAAASGIIRNFSSLNWVSQFILAAVFLAWSLRYSARLRRKFPEISEASYSDLT
jgi:hypothetical protein